MDLGQVFKAFMQLDEDDFVFSEGFSNAHSYRRYFDEVAFEHRSDVTLGEVKAELNKALGDVFTGWKDGEYTYSMGTPTHLTYPGSSADEDGTDFGAVVGLMLIEYMTR